MKSFTARTVPVTGIVLLGFVALHVLDLATGTPGVAAESFQPATPETAHAYEDLVASLQRPWAVTLYMVSMLALLLHLAHGLWTGETLASAPSRPVCSVNSTSPFRLWPVNLWATRHERRRRIADLNILLNRSTEMYD